MLENLHYLKLKDDLDKQICPCGGAFIGIDNWNMFDGERDWFYFCYDCGTTWKHKNTPSDFKLK